MVFDAVVKGIHQLKRRFVIASRRSSPLLGVASGGRPLRCGRACCSVVLVRLEDLIAVFANFTNQRSEECVTASRSCSPPQKSPSLHQSDSLLLCKRKLVVAPGGSSSSHHETDHRVRKLA